MFRPADFELIEKKGILKEDVENQLRRFQEGIRPLSLVNPAVLGDGILRLNHSEIETFANVYEKAKLKVIKFVPASGAATRMFKILYQFLESKKEKKNIQIIDRFFDKLDQFAFNEELMKTHRLIHGNLIQKSERTKVIETLLMEKGLGYGQLPKALLKFHKYGEVIKTPVEEHISEGLTYANKEGEVNLHFTVSPEHFEKFQNHARDVISKHTTTSKIDVGLSIQKPYTDTIAVNLENEPFRSDEGTLLFRPAGHGALLENLNELEANVVFIKNIDNVVKESIREETVLYKKGLAGLLLEYQQKTFSLLRRSEKGENISDEGSQLLSKMGWRGSFDSKDIISLLNRPIRVCGMVRNEGEPGGGPFWVKTEKALSLQIVESSQVKKKLEDQRRIFESGTHFNPVDLVCGIRNFKGEKFDLLKFRDMDSGFISEKSHQGRKLKALELPGLWNGSMAYWNTIFVEVPLSTFSPVKTVMDLLKEAHR